MWVKRPGWQKAALAGAQCQLGRLLHLSTYCTKQTSSHSQAQPGRQSSNCSRRIPNQIKPQMFCQTDRAVKRLDCACARPKPVPGVDPAPVSVPVPSPRLQLQLQLQARLSRAGASDNDDNVQRSNEPERFYAPRAFFTFEVSAAKREEGEGEEER